VLPEFKSISNASTSVCVEHGLKTNLVNEQMGPVRLDYMFRFPVRMDGRSDFVFHRHQLGVGTMCADKDARIQTGRYYNPEPHERLPRRDREFSILNIYPKLSCYVERHIQDTHNNMAL